MPLIDYVRYENAPESVKEALAGSAYAESEDRHLFYEMLSNAPDVVPARANYFKQLMGEGAVPKREKELAYFVVALVTRTQFVAATHGRYLVDDHGYDRQMLTALARGDCSGFSSRETAVIDFVQTVVSNPNAIDETDVTALKETGYEEGEVIELLLLTCDAESATSIVSAMNMELADRGETEPDFLPAEFTL